MAYISTKEFLIEVAKGKVPGHSVLTIFGENDAIGTSITPVTSSGTYETPSAVQALDIVSSDANDTALGTGGRKVIVQGVDAVGDSLIEEVTMNGLTPVTLSASFLRVFNVEVSESGSYASATAPSHLGTITLFVSGGGTTWATIGVTAGLGLGQSKIGVFTVPTGLTAYVLSLSFSVDTNKAVNLFFLKREDILITSAPFGVMSMQGLLKAATGIGVFPKKAFTEYKENTDIGFMASVASGTSDVSVVFELLLIDNTFL